MITTPDVMKLDRSIVDGVSTDPVLANLIRSLVDFDHGCNAHLVAEGVETAADAVALLALGVGFGQGWHFGRPGPLENLPGRTPPVVADLPVQGPMPATPAVGR
ncbi:MAG: EAL domain-containing protein [Actinomycetota bacterium]|nr:EAL domain-containing protein [Actinomycetota bacterium]